MAGLEDVVNLANRSGEESNDLGLPSVYFTLDDQAQAEIGLYQMVATDVLGEGNARKKEELAAFQGISRVILPHLTEEVKHPSLKGNNDKLQATYKYLVDAIRRWVLFTIMCDDVADTFEGNEAKAFMDFSYNVLERYFQLICDSDDFKKDPQSRKNKTEIYDRLYREAYNETPHNPFNSSDGDKDPAEKYGKYWKYLGMQASLLTKMMKDYAYMPNCQDPVVLTEMEKQFKLMLATCRYSFDYRQKMKEGKTEEIFAETPDVQTLIRKTKAGMSTGFMVAMAATFFNKQDRENFLKLCDLIDTPGRIANDFLIKNGEPNSFFFLALLMMTDVERATFITQVQASDEVHVAVGSQKSAPAWHHKCLEPEITSQLAVEFETSIENIRALDREYPSLGIGSYVAGCFDFAEFYLKSVPKETMAATARVFTSTTSTDGADVGSSVKAVLDSMMPFEEK